MPKIKDVWTDVKEFAEWNYRTMDVAEWLVVGGVVTIIIVMTTLSLIFT